jgi:chromosome segregation ATPase
MFPFFRFIAGALVLVGLSGCNDGGAARVKSLQSELDQLTSSVFEAQQTTRRLEAQLKSAQEEKAKLEATVNKAKEEMEATKAELEQLKKDFDAYKSKYKVSLNERVPGLQIPDFTHKGTEYAAITVTQFDETTLAFRHKAGLGKLALADLPEVVRDVLALTKNHLPMFTLVQEGKPVSAKHRRQAKLDELDAEERKLEAERKQLSENVSAKSRAIAAAKSDLSRHRALKPGEPIPVRLTRRVDGLEREMSELQGQVAELDVKRWDVDARRRQVQ